jgi:hypothetical protein
MRLNGRRVVGAAGLLLAGWLAAPAGRAAAPAQEGPPPGATAAPAATTVTLRMIVASSTDAAERAMSRLRAGEPFANVARDGSTAPNAASGGWLGAQPLASLRPEVRRALEGLAPGQITPIVRIPTGYAIFEVEPDAASAGSAGVDRALAASGAVRYVYDFSGFSEARAALLVETGRQPDQNTSPRGVCDARTRSLASTYETVSAFLAPSNRDGLAAQDPVDVLQLMVGLGALDAYEGRMAASIAHYEDAYRYAATHVPDAALPLDEALGIAYLHKAGLDNHVFERPEDYCLLLVRPGRPYPRSDDSEQAIAHFERYLAARPDDLEVRWLLNLAYRTIGGYPDRVPPAFLVPPSEVAPGPSVARFVDVAPEAGLDHVGMAGGVVVDDLSGTGRFDIVTSTMDSCGPVRLFASNGDGTFSDRTQEAGLADELGGLNIVAGDYDNDGCRDLVVLRGGWEQLPQPLSLLRNDCHGRFTNVTEAAGLTMPSVTQTAVWTDIDNDGWLDLFVGNENEPAELFHNTGRGTFENIAEAAGVDRVAYTKGVTAGDYDNDGYPDLYVSNYGETNFLYHNDRNGTFTEVSREAGVRGTPTGFATWFFDYDNDGWTDLFVTSYIASVDEMVRDDLGEPHNATTMKLYRNRGDGTFEDVSHVAGLDRVLMPMGSDIGDIDNDGYLDVYLGTGSPSYGSLQGSRLLHNEDGRRFVDVTAASGTGELHKGHGVAFADLDNDGDEDLIFKVGGATPGDAHAMRLFENPGASGAWVSVALVGRRTNRSAVGARVTATIRTRDGRTRAVYRTIGEGGSFGVSPLEQHIGLGRNVARVDLDVAWPASGTRQHFGNVGVNRWLRIDEGRAELTRVSRARVRLGGKGRTR